MNNRFVRNLQFILLALDVLAINITFFTVQFYFRREAMIEAYAGLYAEMAKK